MGCSPQPPVSPPPQNVILLLVDTLRADHLGTYGYSRSTSPGLDRLAENMVVFENALSQAACTFPSVNSIFTSRYPASLRPSSPGDWSIPASLATLPEILLERGYSTLAISASPVVRRTPSHHNTTGGYDRGFSVFDETCLGKDASCIGQRARHLLTEPDAPVFLYLHYMEPHNPYQPPPHHRRRFATASRPAPFIRRGNLGPISRMLYLGGDAVDVAAEDRRHLVDLYDDEISYLDSSVTALLQDIDRTLDPAETILVIASDHGEELFDHGEVSHCRDLAWQSVLHVPLAFRIPRVSGRRRSSPVENLDIVPTILDYLRFPSSALALEGRSLRPLIEGDEAVHQYVFAAQGRYRVVSDGRFKLRLDLATQAQSLYDLEADPNEINDLSGQGRDHEELLSDALRQWLGGQEQLGETADVLEKARETQRQLDAFGYL